MSRGRTRQGTMNERMGGVFTLLGLGFVGVVAMLTWWQLIVAGDLRQKDYNNQTAYYEQRVQRGLIRMANGRVVAGRAAVRGPDGDRIWRRTYPLHTIAAHVVGYDSRGKKRTGVERQYNDVLTGSLRDLGAVVGLLDGNEESKGDDVQLTLNLAGQQAAERALSRSGSPGAIVALDPKTGRVLVMASAPTYDPSDVDRNFAKVTRSGSALINRATQGQYAPGSTFKLVTAAAALEDGMQPTARFPGVSSYTPKYARNDPVQNFDGENLGDHDLRFALTHSINTTFAKIGDDLGKEKLRDQMAAFGFDSRPEIEGLPTSEVRASGLRSPDHKLLDKDADLDTARVAIGQERLAVTPLQMAMVASAIANGGMLMRPYVVERAGGDTTSPDELGRAVSEQTARDLTRMMEDVVKDGTGTPAALENVDIAGKTGTADTGSGNQVWFVAFAPANDPQVAIAVTLEGQASGQTGGAVAGPLARDVIEALL